MSRYVIKGRPGAPSAIPVARSVPLNTKIREYILASKELSKGESWAAAPELPTSSEILGIADGINPGDPVELAPNQIHGPWPDRDSYLKSHYDLLREDAIAPLRDAVAYVRQSPRMRDSHDVCIYEKVHIVGVTCAQAGIAIRIEFSTARAGRNIVWEYSQRLRTGSIVALTPANDVFKTRCVVALVAARPLEGLKATPCQIDLLFADPNDTDFDYQQEWLLVEARSGYYEASRHTLLALQKLSAERFPLSEYICGLKRDIDAPEYLKQNPVVDMSALRSPDEESRLNALEDWPCPPARLDASQWKALQQILTKKLAIVQGPPGTGKTHVSVEAIRVLLSNMTANDPPIILAAQTNHALDQLLRHVSAFEDNYVRLGGRSTDPEIKRQTVFELRKKSNLPFVLGGALGPAFKTQKALTDKITQLLEPFSAEKSGRPLSASYFLALGLITQSQYDSLEREAAAWARSSEDDSMSSWLGNSLVSYRVAYKTESFGFVEDEIDLQYEQLKELEAEQGIDDDYDESLKGQWISLREGFVGRTSRANQSMHHLQHSDMWQIPDSARGQVYSMLQRRAKDIVREKLRAIAKEYQITTTNLKIGKWERDTVVLQKAKVIGMTTTGLCKYRALVSSINPKIILVEEAAEILEAPVTAACFETLQHLILVGDHKQLQGHCAVKDLEDEPFYLNISMFERLVGNNMDFRCLTKQRRMAPEIRRVLAPIYDNLEDHQDVLNRPDIPGMGGVNSYFFCHPWSESSDSLLSKYNENEAKMVVGFYLYLFQNGTPSEKITVLTFYNGQRKKILKALKDSPLLQGHYLKVVTVDSYQGEENDVVILSLVRSSETTIGFLAIENRVCVALSRARRGFYIFGNAEAISIQNGLWWEVVQIMRENPKRLGYYLPATCASHGVQTFIRDPEIWKKLNGGCLSACEENLDCGHQCPLQCHPFGHETVRCGEPCQRPISCGHICKKKCYQTCTCDCEVFSAARASIMALDQLNTLPTRLPTKLSTTPANTHTEQMASVQRYHDFANGGARQADAQLQLETLQRAAEERLKITDAENFAALFEDELPDGAQKENIPTERVTNIPGTSRYRYVQVYSGKPETSKAGETSQQQPSLLDL